MTRFSGNRLSQHHFASFFRVIKALRLSTTVLVNMDVTAYLSQVAGGLEVESYHTSPWYSIVFPICSEYVINVHFKWLTRLEMVLGGRTDPAFKVSETRRWTRLEGEEYIEVPLRVITVTRSMQAMSPGL